MTGMDYLIAMGYLAKIKPDRQLAEKEFKESELDLLEAQKDFEEKGHKWATIKAYYSMFHAARAMMFLMGFKERSHYAVGEFLEAICKEGKLESSYANDYRAAMSAREGADYHYDYDQKTAEEIVAMAVEFTKRMRKLAKLS
ncbi:MAG: HEPN domain-containing protein [Candidatus Micrarchaeota archaeon]